MKEILADSQRLASSIKPIFLDRGDAGERLLREVEEPMSIAGVVAVANGGIPVAVPFWQNLRLNPSVLPVSKIRADPENDLFGIGAVTESGEVLNNDLIDFFGIQKADVEKARDEARDRLSKKEMTLAGYLRSGVDKEGDILVVDDGIASGFSILAAIEVVGSRFPERKIMIATPVIERSAHEMIQDSDHEVKSLHISTGTGFIVDAFYKSFEEVGPNDARRVLDGIS